jgi:hypothetical protein
MVDIPPPGLDPVQEQVISDELDRAVGTIGRRLERQERTLIVAGGPAGGEYDRITEAVVQGVARALPQQKIGAVETAGSVENAWLLDRGEADVALMQSDIAVLAANGEGAFARGGPLTTLRALASPCTSSSPPARRSAAWRTCVESAWASGRATRARTTRRSPS